MLNPARAGLLMAAAVFLADRPALAADSTPPTADAVAPSARSLELTRRYFAAMQMEKTVQVTVKAMMPAVIDRMSKANPKLTQGQKAAIAEAADESSQAMVARMTDRMAPIFATTFTERELEDLVAFYEGPTGRALVTKSPVFAARMGQVMRELAPAMSADMEQRFCAKVACPPKPAAARR